MLKTSILLRYMYIPYHAHGYDQGMYIGSVLCDYCNDNITSLRTFASKLMQGYRVPHDLVAYYDDGNECPEYLYQGLLELVSTLTPSERELQYATLEMLLFGSTIMTGTEAYKLQETHHMACEGSTYGEHVADLWTRLLWVALQADTYV